MANAPQPSSPESAIWPGRPLAAASSAWRSAPAGLVWAFGWGLMLWLDGQVDLANLAMLLVLVSTLASLWLPGWMSVLAAAGSVLGFNWAFVPPRHSFDVDLRQHALLLLAMLVVSWIVSALMARQRRLVEAARHHARREARLRSWGDALRDAADPVTHASALRDALEELSGLGASVLVLTHAGARTDDEASVLRVGEVDADQKAGLALCVREGKPLGPGTGRYAEQPDVYLPLRGRNTALGAAVLRGLGHREGLDGMRAHAQALCDQMGMALQRIFAARAEQHSREAAQVQAVRNALLAAISHDYRTPLATIMGAASSLESQAERMDIAQRRKLAAGIVEEATRLARLTENTLQLARLDVPGVVLRCDWESTEEIVGAVLRRVRARDPHRRVRARLEPELPLLWCDAMLISQLLENLVDNALKYSPADRPVEILARRQGPQLMLAVRDRGPGVGAAWRDRIFDVFQRGEAPPAPAVSEKLPAGSGVGLAVCRAIARAHAGELSLRARSHGGSSFECLLPLRDSPPMPPPAPAAEPP